MFYTHKLLLLYLYRLYNTLLCCIAFQLGGGGEWNGVDGRCNTKESGEVQILGADRRCEREVSKRAQAGWNGWRRGPGVICVVEWVEKRVRIYLCGGTAVEESQE